MPRNRIVYWLCLLVALFSLPLPSAAAPVQTDYNGDGLSDFTLVTIPSSGSLTWNANLSGGGELSLGTLGKNGDQLILADWLGLGKPQIGVVTLNGSNVTWKIVDQNGATQQVAFGNKQDLLISGGDFNGNGTADAALARLHGKRIIWKLKLDMFATTDAPVTQISFGSDGDRVFYMSPDGVSDWLAVLGKAKNGHPRLRLKNVTTGEVRTFSTFPTFVTSDPRPRPFPVKQADGTDLLGFARVSGKNTRVDLVNLSGQDVANATLPGKGDVIVGNFTADAGEELAIKTSSGFTVYSPATGAMTQVATGSGVAVDEININQVTGTGDTGDDNTGGNGGGNGGGNAPGCSSVVDIGGLGDILYKNENVHGGRGRSWLDQDHRLGGTRTLSILGLDGAKFGCFGLYACDQPFGCRYYQALCGDSLSNSAFIAAARAHGGGSAQALVSGGGGTCYKFQADSPRYGNVRK